MSAGSILEKAGFVPSATSISWEICLPTEGKRNWIGLIQIWQVVLRQPADQKTDPGKNVAKGWITLKQFQSAQAPNRVPVL